MGSHERKPHEQNRRAEQNLEVKAPEISVLRAEVFRQENCSDAHRYEQTGVNNRLLDELLLELQASLLLLNSAHLLFGLLDFLQNPSVHDYVLFHGPLPNFVHQHHQGDYGASPKQCELVVSHKHVLSDLSKYLTCAGCPIRKPALDFHVRLFPTLA